MELSILIKLRDHPFISTAKYAFQDHHHLYLVMELLNGGDLRFHIRKNTNHVISESVSKFYITQLILAVQECHDHNILHRGIYSR
jgi:serine/threonine protein kinase